MNQQTNISLCPDLWRVVYFHAHKNELRRVNGELHARMRDVLDRIEQLRLGHVAYIARNGRGFMDSSEHYTIKNEFLMSRYARAQEQRMKHNKH